MIRLLRSAFAIVRPAAADVLDGGTVILSGHPKTLGTSPFYGCAYPPVAIGAV